MQSFKHDGINIELMDNGKFRAKVNGQLILRPSLDAVRKYIDNEGKNTFKPFAAYSRMHYHNGVQLIKVSGLIKMTRGYRKGELTFDLGGSGEKQEVYAKESLPEINAAEAFDKESKRIAIQREEESEKLWEKVKKINANTYKPE